jgi:DNA polymerase V
MSDRVMKTFASFVPALEIYSIDESFLDLHNLPYTNLLSLGVKIKRTVEQNTGIPVSIGIAPTKTLAKMANRYAKKKHKQTGVFWAANKQLTDEMLAATAIGDVWGIGHEYALLLNKHGFKTAADVVLAPDDWIRNNLSVIGLRLVNELRGIPAIEWEYETPAKKNICTSRAFGKLLTKRTDIEEALVNYAANCALKLRQQKNCCEKMQVFLHTNPHKTEQKQYQRSINVQLERATNNTAEIIKYALKGFDVIYQPGYHFMKAGVIVMNLVHEDEVQSSMFDAANSGRNKKLMDAIDKVNGSLGKEIVRMAVQGFEKKYRLRADHLSPKYTTNIRDIVKIRI